MKNPSRRRAAALASPVLAAALALSCAACGGSAGGSGAGSPASPAAAQSFPVTVTAANGAVHVKSRPKAIISLAPTATEMLYAIGAGSQVKAVDDDSDYPPQAPRTKLSGFTPNIEAIVAYHPDLVVITNNMNNVVRKLAAFSIPVLELPAPTEVSGVYTEFDQLGKATGHLAQAEHESASIQRQIQKIIKSVPARQHDLTYYYELEQDYYSITSSTFVGKLLGLLHLRSIADAAKGAAAAGGYPQLSEEYILRSRPDYIILADTICCHQSAATVAKRPGWSVLPAVRDGRIIALNDDVASRWGPRIVDLLQAVADGIRNHGTP